MFHLFCPRLKSCSFFAQIYIFATLVLELAMHYRVIFQHGCFISQEIVSCHVLAHISCDKSKTVPE